VGVVAREERSVRPVSIDSFVLTTIELEDKDIVSMTMERGVMAFVRPEFPSLLSLPLTKL
jgi:hypothetical protein